MSKQAKQLYIELLAYEDSDALDDMVHDAASEIGSNVNNGGLQSQIEFLLEQGYAESDIRNAVRRS